MEETKKNWAEVLKNRSVLVNVCDVERFCEFFKSMGLVPNGGALVGNQQVIYF